MRENYLKEKEEIESEKLVINSIGAMNTDNDKSDSKEISVADDSKKSDKDTTEESKKENNEK